MSGFKSKLILSNIIVGLFLTGCSISFVPYPSGLFDSQTKIEEETAKGSYRNYKVFTGIEIAGRTIEGVLDALSLYQNKNYIYVSPYHIVFPDNIDLKITNLKELKIAVETYTPFTLKFEKKPYNTYVVIAKVKDSRKLKVEQTKGTLGEILKEIADIYNANLIIDKNAFKENELGKYDTYVLNTNTVYDLKEAVSAYHNVFIDYNPYNKSVRVYKYKYVKKVLPGFDKEEIERYLSGLFSYDESLQKPNSFYISKDGLVVIKTTYSNYFEALKILNTLKELNDRNINLEFDYFKVRTLDKIPYSLIVSKIKSCGNYECVKKTIENYGTLIEWQKNYTTSKINRNGRVLSKEKKSQIEFDYKTFVDSLKNKKLLISYSMYRHKDNTELIRGNQTLYFNTYVPIYIKTEDSNGSYINTYYIIKVSSVLF